MPLISIVFTTRPDQYRRLAAVIEGGDVGTMVGTYRFPSKTEAECPGFSCPQHRGENVFGWGRHHTNQHITHGACQRRRPGFRRRLKVALMDLFGVNLLARDNTPAIFRNPTGYDHPEAFPPIAVDGVRS